MYLFEFLHKHWVALVVSLLLWVVLFVVFIY